MQKAPHINNFPPTHTHACMQKPTYVHTNKQLIDFPIITILPLYKENKANLGATCGAQMEAPTEASEAAEDVVG